MKERKPDGVHWSAGTRAGSIADPSPGKGEGRCEIYNAWGGWDPRIDSYTQRGGCAHLIHLTGSTPVFPGSAEQPFPDACSVCRSRIAAGGSVAVETQEDRHKARDGWMAACTAVHGAVRDSCGLCVTQRGALLAKISTALYYSLSGLLLSFPLLTTSPGLFLLQFLPTRFH